MSNVTQRIHELTARRQRLWARPWRLWHPDMEARIHHLTRLLEEAHAESENPWPKGSDCDDCLLRRQMRQPAYMRVRHVDRGMPLPTGRLLDVRCETCGGTQRVPYPRF